MLSKVEIHNYQSLKNVSVELGNFTVIVGPSSSGKSAFTRALKTMVSNTRGDSFVTIGEQTSSIIVHTDNGIVGLKRGKENEYTLLPNQPDALKKTFTKLGGAVPEEVTEFLGIQPKDAINFAGQFDKPYLLDDSASEVARQLGTLTNVSIIFEGAREANKRRSNYATTLKTRATDLQSIREKSETYRTLKDDKLRLEEVEALLDEARRLTSAKDRLQRALDTYTLAQSQLEELESRASVAIPDITKLLKLKDLRDRVLSLSNDYDKATQSRTQALSMIESIDKQSDALLSEYTQTLINAGTCPTCKQSTKELTHGH